MTQTTRGNVDRGEVSKFDEIARKWWDTSSEFKPLHDINPLRLRYITDRVDLSDKRVLDVGCGGGILTESLARAGATVTGTDMSAKALQVARLHAHESRLDGRIDYEQTSVEDYATAQAGTFDVITCLELLEHVPEPASVIAACKTLLKPGGHLFLSTINRNPKSYLFAVIGGEYILNLLPRGTHDYAKFIKPAELGRMLRDADFRLRDITGMIYNPVSRTYRLSPHDTDVNYLAYAVSAG